MARVLRISWTGSRSSTMKSAALPGSTVPSDFAPSASAAFREGLDDLHRRQTRLDHQLHLPVLKESREPPGWPTVVELKMLSAKKKPERTARFRPAKGCNITHLPV